jgi:hypothetical protein
LRSDSGSSEYNQVSFRFENALRARYVGPSGIELKTPDLKKTYFSDPPQFVRHLKSLLE